MRLLLPLLLGGCSAASSAAGILPDEVWIEHSLHRGGDVYGRIDGGAIYAGENDSYTLSFGASWWIGERFRDADAERRDAALYEAIRLLSEDNDRLLSAVEVNTAATYEAAGADVPPKIDVNVGQSTTVDEEPLEKHATAILLALGSALGLVVLLIARKLLKAEGEPEIEKS